MGITRVDVEIFYIISTKEVKVEQKWVTLEKKERRERLTVDQSNSHNSEVNSKHPQKHAHTYIRKQLKQIIYG